MTAALIESDVDRRAAPGRADALRRIGTLSEREREVLRLLAGGESNAELDDSSSARPPSRPCSRLLAELGLTNRTQAAIVAHEAGPHG